MSGMGGMKLFRSKKVLLEDGLQEAGILVGQEGKIDRILRKDELATLQHNAEVLDVGNLVIMPGLVDSHVHVNEPGRTEWEGYWTATRAAAAGGVTTIVDMPLNSIPPTTTKKNLETKMIAAKGKKHVDVAFWGGVVPGNQNELKDMVEAGVVGFKCFLCPSGVDEFPEVTKEDVELSLKELEGTNSVLAFHAECELGAELVMPSDNPCEYRTFLRSRPPKMEVTAVQLITQLCSKYSVRCHIVHLSAAEALPFVRAAKSSGLPLTAETCHQYLTLNAEAIPDCATQYKCCPPIRGLQNRERLWAALVAGELDMVVSDHSPCTPEMKQTRGGKAQFLTAWGGISSLQFGLSLFWTEARKRGFSIADISRFLSQNPSKLCGLQYAKGQLKEGMDADLVIWDPEAKFQVEKSIIQHKHKLTPYLGKWLNGRVIYTILRGQAVYQNGKFSPPLGRLVLSSASKH
ncbi:Allantoinase, mitochondrial [Cryptotermes secundus]|nr:allantoinase, mitochondrial isoform X2 [Cryptotermes secundus]PNF40904.1 Allantoinase, mitochondrial [Cryptotermes secundus]